MVAPALLVAPANPLLDLPIAQPLPPPVLPLPVNGDPEEDEEDEEKKGAAGGIEAHSFKGDLPKEITRKKDTETGQPLYFLGKEEIKLNPKTNNVEFIGETFKNRPNLFTLIMSDGKGEDFVEATKDVDAVNDYAKILVKSNVLCKDGDYRNSAPDGNISHSKYNKYGKFLRNIWYNRFLFMSDGRA